MSTPFTELQMDALRELANIGSGTASTALASMLGRPVDISVPNAQALPFADAVDAIGPAEQIVTGVVLDVIGELDATVLLLLEESDAATLCGLLGVDPEDEMAASALGEIGNIVGASYINALGAMTGLELEPEPPVSATDMLAAIVATVLTGRAQGDDIALVLDSQLAVEGEDCSISFVLVPTRGGVEELLARLGLES
ncbi:MAG TPA: chemotaxis protein CheC [Solirubrobacteraceae bacterium]|nr:chemotaxis protein CheC [Solirubrobacteraceae bacterium]